MNLFELFPSSPWTGSSLWYTRSLQHETCSKHTVTYIELSSRPKLPVATLTATPELQQPLGHAAHCAVAAELSCAGERACFAVRLQPRRLMSPEARVKSLKAQRSSLAAQHLLRLLKDQLCVE